MSRSLPKEHIRYLERQGAKKGRDEARLTEREREVLQLLAEGKVMIEVGSILGMSTRTVAFHKYTIMEQLGLKTTAELIQYAVKHGLARS